MIYGIGTDLCDIRRIRATLARRGERFAEKVLGPHELAVFRERRAKVEARGEAYLATRFAAKEAFSMAIGLGLRMRGLALGQRVAPSAQVLRQRIELFLEIAVVFPAACGDEDRCRDHQEALHFFAPFFTAAFCLRCAATSSSSR